MAKEYTIIVVKPDGVAAGLVEPISTMLQERDVVILDQVALQPKRIMIEQHLCYDRAYEQKLGQKILALHEHKNITPSQTGMEGLSADMIGAILKQAVIDYYTSGTNVALLLQGENAIQNVKAFCGTTFPADSAPDTIRGMFATDCFEICMRERRSPYNIAHAADSVAEAEHQIPLWFPYFEPRYGLR